MSAPPRTRRPGLLAWLHLRLTVERMDAKNRRGDEAGVVRIGERYARSGRGDARFHLRLAGAYWALSRWADAIRHGRRVLAINPANAPAAIFLLASYRSHDPQRGIAFGERWLARQPLDADVCRHLALLLDDMNRAPDALALALRGFQAFPRDRRLGACAAYFMAKAAGAVAAREFVAEHEALFAGDDYAESTIAYGLRAAGDHAEADRLLTGLRQRQPHNAGFLAATLELWNHQGRHEEIVTAAEAWDRTHAMTPAIANEAARACVELGRHAAALAWIDRAVAHAPDHPLYADNRAVTLGRIGRHPEAIAACRARLTVAGTCDVRRLQTTLGLSLAATGDAPGALAAHEAALRADPRHPESIANLLEAMNAVDRHDDAVAFAEAHRDDEGLPPRFWREFAWAQHQRARHREEEAVVRHWAALHPDDFDLPRAFLRLMNAQNRAAEALAFAQQWAEAHANAMWAWRFLAEQHETMGNADAEVAAIDRACSIAPDQPELAAEKIAILRRLKRPREALAFGRSWLAANGDVGVVLNRTGLAADDLEDWTAAELLYRRAHACEPTQGRFVGNLVRALLLQGRPTDAAGVGQRWLAEHPWDGYVAINLASALREDGRTTEEEAVLRRIAADDPKNVDVNFDLLRSLLAQHRTADAETWLQHCESLGAASSGMWNDWANHLLDCQQPEACETAYRQALARDPDNQVPAGNLAAFLIEHGRTDEALTLCRTWLARRPDDVRVRRQLANAHFAADAFEDAIAEYRRIAEAEAPSLFIIERITAGFRLSGRSAEALAEGERWLQQGEPSAYLLVELAIAAHRLGRPETALTHLEGALRLDPANAAAASRRLRILREQGRLDLALAFGETWLAEHEASATSSVYNDFAIVLDEAGQTERAERAFLNAVAREPDDPIVVGNAVEILARTAKPDEAVALAQRFLAETPPHPYVLRRLAEAYEARGAHEAALDVLGSADALAPHDADIAIAGLRMALRTEELDRGMRFGRQWLARPGNARAAAVWSMFARVCFRADADEEAFAAVRHASELAPDEIRYVRQRYAFWHAVGASNELLADFAGLRAAWQEDAALLRQVSRAYRELGLRQEALEAARRNAAANPADDDACAWLAELYETSGDAVAARRVVDEWIAIHGEHPAVLRIRAGLHLAAGEAEPALHDARAVLAREPADEDAFVIEIRALRTLGRGREAQTRLNHWLEHHDSSARISALLDEPPHD